MVFEQIFLCNSFVAQGTGNLFSNRAHHNGLHRRFSTLASRSVIRVAFVILASVPSYRPKR